jgi:alpha-tubulin suppressor-like RCC1 family protein
MTCVSFASVYDISNRLNESEVKYEKGGTVYVWGDNTIGGATTFEGLPGQIEGLQDVVYIYACDYGYAALLKDTTVYVWGLSDYIGPQGFLQINGERVTGVKTIRSTSQAFAAILENGNVIVWGMSGYGGTPTPSTVVGITFCPPVVVPELSNIEKIYSTFGAFTAVDSNGSAWVWGNPLIGGAIGNGDIYNIPGLQNIVDITCNERNFAALLSDTTVYVWGNGNAGYINASQNIRGIVTGLTNVKKVYKTDYSFAALRYDGTIFIWGSSTDGGSLNGTTRYVNLPITGATNIYSTEGAFVAQLNNQVYIWGNPTTGGNLIYNGGYNPTYIPDIVNVCSTSQAFAGITSNGKIYLWGNPNSGGVNIYGNATQYGLMEISSNITSIVGAYRAFSALTNSGQVIRWGVPLDGGGTNGNPEFFTNLSDIEQLFSNNGSFCAIDINKNVYVYGDSRYGGDQSQVSALRNLRAIFPNVYEFSGAYAVLQIEPDPPTPGDTTSNISPALAGFVGVILGFFIFISFYFISKVDSSNTRYSLFLLSFLISAGAVVLVSLL